MRQSFLGQSFAPLRRADGEHLRPLLARHPQPLSGYSFAVLSCWQPVCSYTWSVPEPDTLLISFTLEGDSRRQLLQPVGRLSRPLLDTLVRQAAKLDYPLRISGVGEPFVRAYPELAARFEVREEPDLANYVYATSDLATLAGHRYAKKRNLLTQAEHGYPWSAEPLAPAHVDACYNIVREVERERPESNAARRTLRQQELCALEVALRDFGDLGLSGILVRVLGRPAGFAIYHPASPGTAVVHFERALRAYKGLYQLVNREAAKAILAQGYTLVNREEDLGDPGLRQAKRSYFPVRLEPAYTLVRKG